MTSTTLLSHRTPRRKPSNRRFAQQLGHMEQQLRNIAQVVRKSLPAPSGAAKPRFIGQK